LSANSLLTSREITTNNLDKEFLEKLTQAILENISDPEFSLDNLQKEFGMSRASLFRKINSLTGNNPSTFVRTTKLKYAAELLIQGKYKINEICYMSGFNYPAHFSRIFRETFGMTPVGISKKQQLVAGRKYKCLIRNV
jgi:AraC-like DNA-binding protein